MNRESAAQNLPILVGRTRVLVFLLTVAAWQLDLPPLWSIFTFHHPLIVTCSTVMLLTLGQTPNHGGTAMSPVRHLTVTNPVVRVGSP